MNCRHCGSSLEHTFLDLGFAPPSNAYLNASDLKRPELYFPLKITVCHHCWLVQTEDYASADLSSQLNMHISPVPLVVGLSMLNDTQSA